MFRIPLLTAVGTAFLLFGVWGCANYTGAPSGQTETLDNADEHAKSEPARNQESGIVRERELTSGIPGDGPLTLEQIAHWLADEQVHQTLTNPRVGLDQAVSMSENVLPTIQNPLTRAKIELGRQLFFDARLSVDDTMSCASCHDPVQGYTVHAKFGVGVDGQEGNRNPPVSYNRILSSSQFWDGRAASLEEQVKAPITNPTEMANTHDRAVMTIRGVEGYRLQFKRIFPDEGLTIDTIAKAIASFMKVIVTGPSSFDYYEKLRNVENACPTEEDLAQLKLEAPVVYAEYESAKAAAERHPMLDSALRGRELFFGSRGGCTACHVGPNLTDEGYHNLGVGMDAEQPDLGRVEQTKDEKDTGAFKTPTIRNVAMSAPYMHDGSLQTLEEVVEWYDKGGHANKHLSSKIKKLNLNEQEKKDLVEFMKACTGEFPKVNMGRLPD